MTRTRVEQSEEIVYMIAARDLSGGIREFRLHLTTKQWQWQVLSHGDRIVRVTLERYDDATGEYLASSHADVYLGMPAGDYDIHGSEDKSDLIIVCVPWDRSRPVTAEWVSPRAAAAHPDAWYVQGWLARLAGTPPEDVAGLAPTGWPLVEPGRAR